MKKDGKPKERGKPKEIDVDELKNVVGGVRTDGALNSMMASLTADEEKKSSK